MKTIAVINHKGGVGKTATAFNIAGVLSENNKVLVIDIDPQATLTESFGIEWKVAQESGIHTLLSNKAHIEDVMLESKFSPNIYIIPSNLVLATFELTLASSIGSEYILKTKLSRLQQIEKEVEEKLFDYIIIDCPPSLGFFTYNSLIASDYILIPVQTQFPAVFGLPNIFNTLELLEERLQLKPKVIGIVPTMFDARTTQSKEVLDYLRETYKQFVTNSIVRVSQDIGRASAEGKPVNYLYPKSRATEDFYSLTSELLERIEKYENKFAKESEKL